MRTIILGYGKIGRTIYEMLQLTANYTLTVAETSATALQLARDNGVTDIRKIDVTNSSALEQCLEAQDIVINALPHHSVAAVAMMAAEKGLHYFDLTEDVATTHYIKKIAASARSILMPQCGLAPGYISIATYDLMRKFDHIKDVSMRVGALPIYPTNKLKYNLTWSTDGLINEYCMPCEAIVDGLARELLPLEGLEHFSLDGIEYECFNTSGGIGTLCETLAGKVDNLSYKTIRYTGHCELAKLLINELGLGKKRHILKEILESSVPMTLQDEVLIFICVSGYRNGIFMQENFVRKIYGREINGTFRSAIQITTAAGICGAVELFRLGKLGHKGFIRQEQISLADFEATSFGHYYSTR